jgi:predicted RNase H-like HicB family nuclease
METDENPRKWVGETLEELVEEAKQAKIEKVNLHKSRPLQAFSFKERYGV